MFLLSIAEITNKYKPLNHFSQLEISEYGVEIFSNLVDCQPYDSKF